MDVFLQGYRRLLVGICTLEKIFGVLLIANIVINIGAQVFSRYILNQPLVWVEELATYSFIWATFIGASIGLKQKRHISIETISPRLNERQRALLHGIVYVVILALLLMLLPLAWQVMSIEGRSKSISLPIAIPRSWFYSIPLFVGMALMSFTAVYMILAEFFVASGGKRLADISVPVDTNAELAEAAEWH